MTGVQTCALPIWPAQPRHDYLAAYRDVDLALDPFPYPGGTTTLDALWMGVPVLTLAGATPLARQGAALLQRLGLGDWVAATVADYVERGVGHGRQLAAVPMQRADLRQRVLSSELCDGTRVASALEEALLTAWRSRPGAATQQP